MNCLRRVLEPREVTRKQKWLAAICPQRFINAVAKQQAMIENGNAGFFRRGDYAVNVDTGLHSSRARSHSNRCLSAFAVRFVVSIGGSSPKLMFIGAKCFCGVETYRHSAPIAVSAGKVTSDSPRSVRPALIPATRPDATFSIY